MKKILLLVLVMFCFVQASGASQDSTAENYSKMSANELVKAFVTAVTENNQAAVKNFIQIGVNVNQKVTYTQIHYDDYDSHITCSVLEYAARRGYTNIVKELMKANPEIDDINEALITAAEHGKAGVVRELIQINAESYWKQIWSFVNSFVNYSNKEALNIALIRAAEEFPGITVHAATGKRNTRNLENYLDVIKLLIQAGANVNYTDKWGDTPLIKLIKKSLYTEEQKKDRAEIIQVMLKAGANVNHANKEGDVALVVAIKNHDFDAVQILLQTPNININYANNNGDTPLIIAVRCIQRTYIVGNDEQYNACLHSQKIVEKLLETPGVNPHHANKKGDTAIKLLKQVTGMM